jgi:hypothetical protein
MPGFEIELESQSLQALAKAQKEYLQASEDFKCVVQLLGDPRANHLYTLTVKEAVDIQEEKLRRYQLALREVIEILKLPCPAEG